MSIGVPAGEGTSAGGWDGTVRATEATPYVPAGLSVWELSVEKSVGTKADRDYEKRTDTPDGSPTTACTYVAASLRRWKGRSTWANAHTLEGQWKEVRAYGVDDLETWLETAPVTWAWISELLGLHPAGLRSAESWWDSWAAQTTPTMPPETLLAGREHDADSLETRLSTSGQVTTVSGASRDEVVAFIAAVGINRSLNGSGQLLARMAFVDDLRAWRRLINHPKPLVLVPLADGLAAEVPGRCVHHIVVPTVGSALPDIELSPIDPSKAAEALKSTGEVEDDHALELGRLARRSFTALRRRLASALDLHRPPWATAPVPRVTRSVLLAGGWSDELPGDQDIVAKLAGESYEVLRESLVKLGTSDDPFVSFDSGTWTLISPVDAWLLLRSHLSADDLHRFGEVVTAVLGERDPAFDLPEEERWKASLYGKVRGFSATLRECLARSLALLGTYGEDVRARHGHTGAGLVSQLVRVVLDQANADPAGDKWASISDLLPTIAEAAPDSFLDAVRAGLTDDDPVLAKLFSDASDRGLHSSQSPHTGLLWALETAAWSSAHFGAAIDLLARLDAIDPGGQLSNRPFQSLESIFTPRHPENSATVERRLNTIDGLRSRHPGMTWRLMLSMLPVKHGIHMPTREPMFRDWKPPRRRVDSVEYFAFVTEVVTRCIEDAGRDASRWSELVKRATELPPMDRHRVIVALDRLVSARLFDGIDTVEIWRSLRDLAATHREYATADWALPRDEVDAFETLAAKLTPQSSAARHCWLFAEHRPHLGDEALRVDHSAYDARLSDIRRDAVADVEREGGLDEVLRLADDSVVPWAVGVALTDAAGGAHEDLLLDQLNEPGSDSRIQLAHAYFARRYVTEGWPWLERLLAEKRLTALQQARLLLAARDMPKVWQVAESSGQAVADQYWKLFGYQGLGSDFAHVETVARRLVDVGRFAAALDFLCIYGLRQHGSEQPIAELAADALTKLLQDNDSETMLLRQHGFVEIFALLENCVDVLGEEKVAGLEWSYLPVLGHDPQVPSLHGLMANDPAFFVRVLSSVYKARNAGRREPEPVDDPGDSERRAINAYRLLSSWRHVPGVGRDGNLDANRLRGWLNEVANLLRTTGRYEAGMTHVGRMLASAPRESDGAWPSEAVRDLIEDVQSAELDEGFYVEVLNQRGVTTRAIEEGGSQERSLAAGYLEDAQRIADRWPRTAAILRRVGRSYENEANRNEEAAERFRRGLER